MTHNEVLTCHQVIAMTECLVTQAEVLTCHQVIAMTECLVTETVLLSCHRSPVEARPMDQGGG